MSLDLTPSRPGPYHVGVMSEEYGTYYIADPTGFNVLVGVSAPGVVLVGSEEDCRAMCGELNKGAGYVS